MILSVGLFLLAFVPMLIMLMVLRNTEKIYREKYLFLGIAFLWGALIASSMALVIETMVSAFIMDFFLLAVVIAPVVEEFLKPLILRLVKKEIDEVEDGLIFGAVAGLGFAATENLLYGFRSINEGFVVLFALFYLRTIGAGLMHASSTAFTGYGYSSVLMKKQSVFSVLPYFFLAIFIHIVFNLCAVSAIVSHQIFGIVIGVIFSVSLFILMRRKIRSLDQKTTSSRSRFFIHN
jgi:protease PrsW